MKAGSLFAGVVLAAAATAGVHAAEQGLRFEQVFRQDDGAAPLHYQARYLAGGGEHALEVWVDGGSRLKRVTDGALTIHATRTPGDDDFRMTVLDERRRISTRVDRGSLYRIGKFTEWFELAQALRHPRGDYRLERTAAPDGVPAGVQPCEWYELTQSGQASRICWSAQARLPMLIVSQDGRVQWRVTQVDRKPVSPQQFEVRDEGFVRNDASEDMERD